MMENIGVLLQLRWTRQPTPKRLRYEEEKQEKTQSNDKSNNPKYYVSIISRVISLNIDEIPENPAPTLAINYNCAN